jgi:hypothetical protein
MLEAIIKSIESLWNWLIKLKELVSFPRSWLGLRPCLHSTVFWQRKCQQLSTQNKELKNLIEQEKQSRKVCEKVQQNARMRLNVWQSELEEYQRELGFYLSSKK